MATCKDCLHYEVCQYHITEETDMTVNECSHEFKDKSQYAEVKRGKWLWKSNGYRHRYECSVCQTGLSLLFRTNYCPKCGAKMNGGKDE